MRVDTREMTVSPADFQITMTTIIRQSFMNLRIQLLMKERRVQESSMWMTTVGDNCKGVAQGLVDA